MPRNASARFAHVVLALCLGLVPRVATAVPQSLPSVVTHAHTVFLQNDTGFNELQYTAILELSKWGRFDLRDAPEKAELILRLDSGNHVRVLPAGEFPSSSRTAYADSTVPKGYTRISLVDPKTNEVLWSDVHKTDGGKVKNGHLLDGLRDAFNSYEKARR